MSWSDPCSYCGEHRADCTCGHWGDPPPATEPIKESGYPDLTYEVKCRKCGIITEMWFNKESRENRALLRRYAQEHCTFPIHKQCTCDNGSMMFHDLVSYSILAI